MSAAHTGFYAYDYIASLKKWPSSISWKAGVPKDFITAFMKQDSLIRGCSRAPKDDKIWSLPHVFYEGTLTATGVKNLYFPASDVDSLIDIILSNYPDIQPRLLVPAPDKFFTLSAFSTPPTPIRFKTVDALQMYRSGTQLSQDTPIYQQNKAVFEQMHKEGKGTVIAVDVESWEEDHSIVIEIGWSYLAWRTSIISGKTQEVSAVKHFIIEEHREFRNGQYSPDNRDYFSFGRSDTVTLKSTLKQLQDFLNDAKAKGPVIMVFHNASAEKEYFANLKIDTKDWIEGFEPLPLVKNKDVEELLIDLSVNEGDSSASASTSTSSKEHALINEGYVYIQDTQKLYAGSGLPGAIKQIGLQNALNKLEIPSRKMHNAGNDAHYTLALYETLVGEGKFKRDLIEHEKNRKANEAKRQNERGWGDW